MPQTLRDLKDAFDCMLDLLKIAALPSLFVGLYSFLVIYIMVLAAGYGWGLSVWAIPIAMMSPVILVWFRTLQKRYREYLEAVIGLVPFKWDVETAVETWSKITKESRHKKDRKGRIRLAR